MPRRATVNRALAGPLEILCDVWGAPQLAHDVNEFADVVGLIRADRPSSPRRALPLRVQHQHARISLRAPVGLCGHRVDDQAVAVLNQQVTQIGQSRLGTVRFPIQSRVGIGLRRVRNIRPGLAVEVVAVPIRLPVFPLKTLLAGPRLDQRAVNGKVLIGHQGLGAFQDPAEEASGDL